MPEMRFCRHVGVRFTQPTFKKLEEAAKRDDRTVSDIVRQIVLQHLRGAAAAKEEMTHATP